ncbi:cyanophycinase [Sphingobacterium pedocola]|uniref:Cyanophycinase n=1 Tax=Sphingobacterium pedocola TaxID=2082722 RepID=A0ABR9T1N4_9SPHI|nr:cyanophycinase [Sphingobacterium pedocola]MBE8719249.1 cyanophycinase [Sphingobacterium pedocola]
MKNFFAKIYVLFVASVFAVGSAYGQDKGSLFIIGGGDRSPALVKDLVETAHLRPNDYIVVLPMATSIPEESVAYISGQLSEFSQHVITSFNFTKEQANNSQSWIDSVQNARLIYITGGDQNKFMDVVQGTKLYDALHLAYRKGATISGTSAGAAVMSQLMITGEQHQKKDGDSFREVKSKNAVTAQGMGFLTNAIIDQHFIIRSRYNRLLSVLVDHPDKTLIGIDEGTAIVVTGKKVRVTGDSQVIVVSAPKKVQVSDTDTVSFKDANLSLYSHGQNFKLK